MLGSAAGWWDGKTSLDGGLRHESPTFVRSFRPADVAKDELFAHLQVRPHNGLGGKPDGSPANKRMTDLVAFNDGCAPPPFIHTQPYMHMRTLRRRANTALLFCAPQVPRIWRFCLCALRSTYMESQIEKKRGADYVSPHDSPVSQRPSNFNRKVHPSLMPFNNGDLMSMQGALIDQRLRFAHSGQAQQLTKNASSLEVEIVDPATHEEYNKDRVVATNFMWKADVYDHRPYAINGDPYVAPHESPSPNRKRTDVTSEALMTASEFARTAELRVANNTKHASSQKWRDGDDQPFTPYPGLPARPRHAEDANPNMGTWRMGDAQPLVLGEASRLPAGMRRTIEPGHGSPLSVHARKHTDIYTHCHPELEDHKRRAINALDGNAMNASVDKLYNDAAIARFGPRAAAMETAGVLSDISRQGLSWGEMQRRGHTLRKSASVDSFTGEGRAYA